MATTISEPLSTQQVQTKWPSWAWALSIPDVGKILSDPTVTDQGQLESRIAATDWYKTNAPAVRNWQARQQTDPAGAAQDIGQKAADVNDLYKSMGLTPSYQDQVDLATQALQFSWTNAQLRDAVVAHSAVSGKFDPNGSGFMQTSANTLKQLANNYYVSLDDGTAQDWARQIAAGEKTIDDFNPTIQSWAKNKFANAPDVLNAINSGQTTDQYFSPYKAEAAKLLETTAGDVDFVNSPLYSKVLTGGDPTGGTQRPMTLTQMDQYLRTTDQYDHTQGAKTQVADTWAQVAKIMGKQA